MTDSSLPARPASYDKKVALVLQGGGALGSYQAGVYEALASSEYVPDWVAGISIGAVNAAIIAGKRAREPRRPVAQVLGRRNVSPSNMASSPRAAFEIVERSPTAVGFEVLPKRWIVERTFAWISRFRRLARDFERYARTVAAFIRLAMIRIMLRRLAAAFQA